MLDLTRYKKTHFTRNFLVVHCQQLHDTSWNSEDNCGGHIQSPTQIPTTSQLKARTILGEGSS